MAVIRFKKKLELFDTVTNSPYIFEIGDAAVCRLDSVDVGQFPSMDDPVFVYFEKCGAFVISMSYFELIRTPTILASHIESCANCRKNLDDTPKVWSISFTTPFYVCNECGDKYFPGEKEDQYEYDPELYGWVLTTPQRYKDDEWQCSFSYKLDKPGPNKEAVFKGVANIDKASIDALSRKMPFTMHYVDQDAFEDMFERTHFERLFTGINAVIENQIERFDAFIIWDANGRTSNGTSKLDKCWIKWDVKEMTILEK